LSVLTYMQIGMCKSEIVLDRIGFCSCGKSGRVYKKKRLSHDNLQSSLLTLNLIP
jgi:hypothetical protein